MQHPFAPYLNVDQLIPAVQQALHHSDLGELFCEYRLTESVTLDQHLIRNASRNTMQGFNIRSVIGETASSFLSHDLNENSIKKACQNVERNRHHQPRTPLLPIAVPIDNLYTTINPIGSFPLDQRVTLLQSIDQYARSKDVRVTQVSARLNASWQAVLIINQHGQVIEDFRPLIRLDVDITVEHQQQRETGHCGTGGRTLYDEWVTTDCWQQCVDKALAQALIRLEARPAPAGEMPVVLGPGWPGVLLHEAVGHGLEGDANRKKTSAFADKMGQRVAAPGVTVIDDGTMPQRRGSLHVDDEGIPTQRTVLIDDGILVGYMQDQLNGRLMGSASTGNGRRESYQHLPMPRMTNTIMANGQDTLSDMIQAVPFGIYASYFEGGQVDTTSGQFVFSTAEAYLIENGRITTPLKGTMLMGQGPEAMQRIQMIGNDFAMDPGVGVCGKDGQQVPVGVGQPSVLVSSLLVGGKE